MVCGAILNYGFMEKITNGIVIGAAVIAWLTLSVILFIKGKDSNLKNTEEIKQNNTNIPDDMILISKKEYEALLQELETLRNKDSAQ